ncbi:MAG: DEAD/DEAH box helicase [Cytophagales bacterium]
MEQKPSFELLPLSDEVKRAIAEMEYTEPSPIQFQSIPLIAEGHDVIGQAQTGTGKTAAFGLPAIDKIDTKNRNVQCIILCPTRELALQVSNNIKKYAKYKRGLTSLAVYGGESIERQIRSLDQGAQIVVGTPGRVIDHLDRGTLDLSTVHTVILDEADEMLNMGFIDDIKTILSNTPEERQTILFSATMPREIMELTRRFQKNPEIIKITRKEITTTNIEQRYYDVRSEHKVELLCRLLDFHQIKLSLIFCNTKKKVDELVEDLQRKGYAAEGLHGDMRQTSRNQVMSKFRHGVLNILIATDVAARGIDVNDVEAVFNYDLPLDAENYVHRIGRTGRAGRSGFSFSFVSGRDRRLLNDIMAYTKADIAKHEAPSIADVKIAKTNAFITNLNKSTESADLSEFIDRLDTLAEQSGADIKQIAAYLLKEKLKFDNIDETVDLTAANNARRGSDRMGSDRGARSDRRSGSRDGRDFREGRERGERGERSGSDRSRSFDRGPKTERVKGARTSGMARLFINAGKKDRLRPNDIVGAITGETEIKGSQIGNIDMFDKYSFVEVPKNMANEVIDKMSQRKIKGLKVNFEVAND